jgi:hypothetical protein
MDVLARDIGNKGLIAERGSVEDQRLFLSVGPPAESFRPEKEPEFERHIEARQTRVRVRLGLGNVVDGIGAPTDDSADLLKPDFPATDSRAQRGVKPERTTVKTIAWKWF